MTGIVKALKRHTGHEGPIAYNGDRFALTAIQTAGLGHTQRGRNRCAAVTDIEAVIRTLITFRESAQPVLLPKGFKRLRAAGKNLVGIALMPHVPYNPVMRRIENIVQRNGQFNRSQA